MTVKRLSQLYYLNREIDFTRKRLDSLTVEAERASPTNRIGILELIAIVNKRLQRCISERDQLEQYIANISDDLTRQIFTLRFAESLEWEVVARHISTQYSDKYVSNLCYRYLSRNANADQ